jgi:hypothetical protein
MWSIGSASRRRWSVAGVAHEGRLGRWAEGELGLDVQAGTHGGGLLEAVHDRSPTFVSCSPMPSLCPSSGRSGASYTATETEWRRRRRRRATDDRLAAAAQDRPFGFREAARETLAIWDASGEDESVVFGAGISWDRLGSFLDFAGVGYTNVLVPTWIVGNHFTHWIDEIWAICKRSMRPVLRKEGGTTLIHAYPSTYGQELVSIALSDQTNKFQSGFAKS